MNYICVGYYIINEKYMITISFQTQKGGAQKSSLTKMMATIIHYSMPNINVAVLDADAQHSIYVRRHKDMKDLEYDEDALRKHQDLMKSNSKPDYPIYTARLSKGDVVDSIKAIEKQGECNLLFVDLPGTLEAEGINEVVGYLNFIITPIDSDFESVDSSLQYIKKLRQFMNENATHKIIHNSVVFTKYVRNEKSNEFKRFKLIKSMLEEYGIKVLDNTYADSKRLRHELAGTIFPFPQTKEFENISPYPLAQEIIKMIFENINQ